MEKEDIDDRFNDVYKYLCVISVLCAVNAGMLLVNMMV